MIYSSSTAVQGKTQCDVTPIGPITAQRRLRAPGSFAGSPNSSADRPAWRTCVVCAPTALSACVCLQKDSSPLRDANLAYPGGASWPSFVRPVLRIFMPRHQTPKRPPAGDLTASTTDSPAANTRSAGSSRQLFPAPHSADAEVPPAAPAPPPTPAPAAPVLTLAPDAIASIVQGLAALVRPRSPSPPATPRQYSPDTPAVERDTLMSTAQQFLPAASVPAPAPDPGTIGSAGAASSSLV